MKKSILAGVLGLVLLVSCDEAKLSAQSKETELPEFITAVPNPLDREVLGAKIIIENITDEYGVGTTTYMYDKEGNLLYIENEGSFRGVYDEKGRLIAESNRASLKLHEYDNENRKIRTLTLSDYEGHSRLEAYQYNYEKSKNILTAIKEDKEIIDENFSYEKSYQELKDAISKDNRDVLKSFSIDEIIKKGNMVFGEKDIYKIEYQYDDKKRLVSKETGNYFEGDWMYYETEGYEYDEKDRLLSEYHIGGSSSMGIEYEYNEYDDVIKQKDIKYEDNTFYTYKYNDRGDWIERVEYREDGSKEITQRKIQYYK